MPLNDSLTSFKIVAIASAGTGLFGTGAAEIRSTQDLMMFSGVSPIIRTGDAFDAAVHGAQRVRTAFEANVSARVEGFPTRSRRRKSCSLPPGDGKTVSWKIERAAGGRGSSSITSTRPRRRAVPPIIC